VIVGGRLLVFMGIRLQVVVVLGVVLLHVVLLLLLVVVLVGPRLLPLEVVPRVAQQLPLLVRGSLTVLVLEGKEMSFCCF
jgi:hypothetical protein